MVIVAGADGNLGYLAKLMHATGILSANKIAWILNLAQEETYSGMLKAILEEEISKRVGWQIYLTRAHTAPHQY